MAKTVLIVEDNELNMKLFRDLLEAHGYQTSGTSNGFEALDLVCRLLLEKKKAHFDSLMRGACERVPRLRDAPLARQLHGIESFTPDGEFILVEVLECG